MTEPLPSARVTGSDVARLAGVSPATVSYVINDKPGQTIPASTRARVLDAAARLGYRPNAAAKALRAGRSDVVVCLVPDLNYSTVFQGLLSVLARRLSELGLALVVHPAPMDGSRPADLLRTLTPVGVVALTPVDEAVVAELQAAGVRVVIGTSEVRELHPWEISLTSGKLGAAQARHLLSRGHTRIGLVVSARKFPSATDTGHSAALLGEMRAAAQTQIPVLRLPSDSLSAERALAEWVLAEPEVTAVAAMDDELAALIVSSADRLGIDVPGRLAVIGTFNLPICTLVRPTLSTVWIDTGHIMQRFAEVIHAAVEDPASPLPEHISGKSVQVIAREST